MNLLSRETSPYLLQHADNPVHWRPWGEEAFAEARAADKLVLVSVGYATCHWCHVMAHESFEDEEIAAYINANYVAVKVDREERPDVDAVYMAAVQMMSGHGGWPMTVVTLPDQRPVFAGTYLPPRDGDRGTRLGFLSVLQQLATRYRSERALFETQAGRVVEHLQPRRVSAEAVPSVDALGRLVEQLAGQFDAQWGGFGGGPKFPRPVALDALLLAWHVSPDDALREMVTLTLDRMAAGGMHDQIGGGFHRYAVDAFWLVPHFEKMLYDNAQLAITYLDASVAFGRADYAAVTRRTLDYLLREMQAPEGGFYSATDADSRAPDGHMEEGWFFTWTPDELRAALGDSAEVERVYGVTAEGNFEGRNVLHVAAPGDVSASHALLYAARAKRPPPLLDDKIIAAWNGLAISAFARAGFVLSDARYLEAARRAAGFVRDAMTVDGVLSRTWRAGAARNAGVLDDYAFMVAGLIDLFEATGEGEWLALAMKYQQVCDARFADPAGGYFLSASSELIARDKPDYDGAEPCGNSVAIENLLRLEQLTDDVGYRLVAERALSAFAYNIERAPVTVPRMTRALVWFHGSPRQVVVTGGASPLIDVLRATYLPLAVRAIARLDDCGLAGEVTPLFEGRPAGEVAAYVCVGNACGLPARDAAAFRDQLKNLSDP